MTGATAVIVAIVVTVGTALGLVRLRDRRRIRDLEAELAEAYEIKRIMQHARDRKNRRHLHLLVAVPLAWLAGRLQSHARLAAATAASTLVVGGGFVAVDGHQTPEPLAPPAAGAETTEPVLDGDRPDGPGPDYAYSPPKPATTTVSAAAGLPAPVAAERSGSAPIPTAPPLADPAPTPDPTTTTVVTLLEATTTTTTVPEATTTTTVCLNPHGVTVPDKACYRD